MSLVDFDFAMWLPASLHPLRSSRRKGSASDGNSITLFSLQRTFVGSFSRQHTLVNTRSDCQDFVRSHQVRVRAPRDACAPVKSGNFCLLLVEGSTERRFSRPATARPHQFVQMRGCGLRWKSGQDADEGPPRPCQGQGRPSKRQRGVSCRGATDTHRYNLSLTTSVRGASLAPPSC